MLDFARARGRNYFGESFTPDAGEGKVDNVGVAEEVVKKRFDRFQRVGSTELKENYPHTPCCARHFPRIPRTQAMYSESSVRVNGGIAFVSDPSRNCSGGRNFFRHFFNDRVGELRCSRLASDVARQLFRMAIYALQCIAN